MACGPLLVERAYIQIHAGECAEGTDGIRAVEQHARRVPPVLIVALDRHAGILDALHPHVLGALAFRRVQARASEAGIDGKDRVDGIWVIDVIRAD